MAKLAVLFLFGLLLVQYAAAGVTKRDAPAANENNVQQNLEDALKNLQTMLQKTFSQDQIDSFGQQLKQFGDALGEKGKEFLDVANENINKLKTTQ